MMKFFSIGKMKDIILTLPPQALIPIMEASRAALEQQMKEGKIHHAYYSPGSDQIIVMIDYDSSEQWAKDRNMIPILRYCDFESHPIVDLVPYMNDSLEMAKMAAAKMPMPPK